MFVVYGTGLYGRVDVVPGLFYVATKFFHIFWIPILPLESHIVVEELDEGWRGVPIGMNGRSVLAGLLRGLLLRGGIGVVIIGIIAAAMASGDAAQMGLAYRLLGFGAAGVVVGLLTLPLGREPTPERFAEICGLLGVDPNEILQAADQPDEAPDEAEAVPDLDFGIPLNAAPPGGKAMQEHGNPYAHIS
jgi:hypothetical protein